MIARPARRGIRRSRSRRARSPTSCWSLRRRGEIAALRDHTAIVRLDARGAARRGPVVVHLSHVFVEPAHARHRPRGLAARVAAPDRAALRGRRGLRAEHAPIDAGRRDGAAAIRRAPDAHGAAALLRARRLPDDRPGARAVRQPDFRAPERDRPAPRRSRCRSRWSSAASGARHETTMPAAEVRAVVEALYAMFGVHVPRRCAATRCAALRQPTGRARQRDASACYHRRRDHRLLPSGLRRADRRARDADQQVPAGRRGLREPRARAPRRAGAAHGRRDLLRVHTPRVRRRGAHRRAARAGRVAEVPVVAAALSVGAADRRRLPGGGAARARRRRRRARW